jgi:hypothetical protein
VQVAREIDIETVTVRAAWNFTWRRFRHFWREPKWLPRPWAPPPHGVVTLTELADAEYEYDARHISRHVAIHQFKHRQHYDPRGTQVGTFTPPYRHAKTDPLFLRVQLRAHKAWDGWLLLRLPDGKGDIAEPRLRLRITE